MEIKAAMLSTGRISDGKQKRPHSASSSASFSAPMFGTASRTKKIEKNEWDAEARDTNENGGRMNSRGSSPYKSNTMTKLKENSAHQESSQNINKENSKRNGSISPYRNSMVRPPSGGGGGGGGGGSSGRYQDYGSRPGTDSGIEKREGPLVFNRVVTLKDTWAAPLGTYVRTFID